MTAEARPPAVLADGAVLVALPYPSPGHPDHNPFTHAFARELVAQGLPTTVIAPQRRPAPRRRLADQETVDEVAVRRPVFWSPGGRAPFRRARVRASHGRLTTAVLQAADHLPVPSLYWGHFLRPCGAAAVELGRRAGRPAFVVLDEGEQRRTADEVYGPAANAEVLQRATGVLAVSDELGEVARDRYGVDPARLTVLPNAVDTDLFAPGDRSAARRRIGVPEDAFVVAFVGRLDENKGARRLAAAIDLVGDDVVGVFLGRGSLPSRPTRIVGCVTPAEVALHLQAADVLALPSLAEACPHAVLEALACGLPVVVSDRPFMRAIADERCARFVDPQSPPAIAAALTELRDDPGRRVAMGAAGRARAEAFPLRRRVEGVLAWVEPLVAGFGSGER